ncbi:hypothetical protein ACGF12_35915 [Kitasatospora sp. NPDC048296]|uniref:hypothetical protein n=1 Tax=Kitasatospora sp. NPDC048296 TaxID=3364048 RepID=UPI0037190B08
MTHHPACSDPCCALPKRPGLTVRFTDGAPQLHSLSGYAHSEDGFLEVTLPDGPRHLFPAHRIQDVTVVDHQERATEDEDEPLSVRSLANALLALLEEHPEAGPMLVVLGGQGREAGQRSSCWWNGLLNLEPNTRTYGRPGIVELASDGGCNCGD